MPRSSHTCAKHGAVLGFVVHAQHLVHELVRHFVLQDFHEHPPAVVREQRPAKLEPTVLARPASEPAIGVRELERGSAQALLEQARIQVLVDAPNGAQAQPFELERENGAGAFGHSS